MLLESMSQDEYIIHKLHNLSNIDQMLSEDIEEDLGRWCTIDEAAKYLKKHKNSIYNRVNNKEVLSKKFSNNKLIYSKSLILLLDEDIYN